MSKYGVFSGPYFPVFGLNTGKYRPEKTPYLNTFTQCVSVLIVLQVILKIHANKSSPFNVPRKNEKGSCCRKNFLEREGLTLKGFLYIFKTKYMLKSSKKLFNNCLFKNLFSSLRYLSLKIS